jgi:uncharacterized protein YqjF (DUF2071 family)
VVVDVGDPIADPDPLDVFLTARWGLYTVLRRSLAYAPVDHAPWPLHAAEAPVVDDELMAAAGYREASGPWHVRWSPGVAVRVGRPRRVGRVR